MAADQDVQAGLGYEQARDELIDVVRRLEAGGATLEESLALWERGEELAKVCRRWLEGARARLDAALAAEREGGGRGKRGPPPRRASCFPPCPRPFARLLRCAVRYLSASASWTSCDCGAVPRTTVVTPCSSRTRAL